jgi:predicted Zn-dependent protease
VGFWNSNFQELENKDQTLQERYEWWEIEGAIFRRSEKHMKQYRHSIPFHSFLLGRSQDSFWGGTENRRERLFDLCKLQKLDSAPAIKTEHKNASLSPRVLATLIEQVGEWFLPTSIRKGKSPLNLQDKEALLFSDSFSLADDGLCQDTPWFAPFDLEGVSPQKTPLLVHGVFKEALYDSYQGAIDNKRSTGNSVRHFSEMEPHLGFRMLTVEPGKEGPDEIWAKEGRGLAFDGWSHLRFSSFFEIEGTLWGWEVDNGIKVRPIKLEGIHWNLVDLFSRVFKACSDCKRHNFIVTPTLFFKDVL